MDAERTTRDLDAFVDLILADPEFLKAEFEALMSDAWSPPGATIRCAVGTHRPRRPATWSLGHVAEDSILGWTPRRLGRTRQRSPPHKDGHSWVPRGPTPRGTPPRP